MKYGANIAARYQLNKNYGQLGIGTQTNGSLPLGASLREVNPYLTTLDQYERIVENSQSLALAYEIDTSLAQYLQLQYDLF